MSNDQPISDRYVTVGEFTVPLEAELARARLEDEGIRTFVMGGMAATTLSGFGAVGGPIQVQVPEADAPRATAILVSCGVEESLDEDWQDQVDSQKDVWVCTLCGEGVPLDLNVCPSCQTPRTSVREAKSSFPSAPANKDAITRRDQVATAPSIPASLPLMEADVDIPDPETFLGDDMARRAFWSTLFAFLFLPFALYSLWLVAKLSVYPGELSNRGLRHFYLTLILNPVVLIVWTFLIVWIRSLIL